MTCFIRIKYIIQYVMKNFLYIQNVYNIRNLNNRIYVLPGFPVEIGHYSKITAVSVD